VIIHFSSMTAAVLGKAVGLLPPGGLAVSPLGFTAASLPAVTAAVGRTVGQAPEATTADTEGDPAKAAAKLDEEHGPNPVLANGRRPCYN